MFFINTPYTLTFKGNLDLTDADSITIYHDDPIYNNTSQWSATAVNKNIYFSISETDINRRGTYTFQVVAVIGGLTRRTGYARITFEKSIFQ
jgi:hypothetical protein